jgi:hypothetical protein
MLAHGDRIRHAGAEPIKARRRTALKFGQLTVVVVEQIDEPTEVFLSNGEHDPAIVEATAAELSEAAKAVSKILAAPPPRRRSR